MTVRRELNFDNWDQVETDLTQLLDQGYVQVGKWNLSQNCRHLNDWLSFTMDGAPPAPFPIRMIMTVIRVVGGKRMLKKVLESGKMPAGGPTVPQTVYQAADQNDARSVEQLRATIQMFREYGQPIKPSMIFGDLDYETAQRLQLIHFAHHLSFLVPKETTP